MQFFNIKIACIKKQTSKNQQANKQKKKAPVQNSIKEGKGKLFLKHLVSLSLGSDTVFSEKFPVPPSTD